MLASKDRSLADGWWLMADGGGDEPFHVHHAATSHMLSRKWWTRAVSATRSTRRRPSRPWKIAGVSSESACRREVHTDSVEHLKPLRSQQGILEDSNHDGLLPDVRHTQAHRSSNIAFLCSRSTHEEERSRPPSPSVGYVRRSCLLPTHPHLQPGASLLERRPRSGHLGQRDCKRYLRLALLSRS